MNKEFQFSFSREAMLKRCPREYFLHTVYAYGAYDVESADKARNHVHLLKQLKSRVGFKEALMEKCLRRIFIDGTDIKDLKSSLEVAFLKSQSNMIFGAYEKDHLRNPVLKPFYYNEENIGQMFHELHEELMFMVDELLANDLFLNLFHQDRLNFYPLTDVSYVYIGRIKVYFPLCGIIKMDGCYYNISFCRSEEFYNTAAVLNILYDFAELHVSPDRVRHVFLSSEKPFHYLQNNYDLNISQTMNDIAERSAQHHFNCRNLLNSKNPMQIKTSGNDDICKQCRFFEFCK